MLIDFVSKRTNGMSSINHEMILSDNHKTILKYFSEVGANFWNSLKLNYNSEYSESLFDKTNYYVKFFQTELLEIKTLELLLMEKKLTQIKMEQEEIFNYQKLIIEKELNIIKDIQIDKTYFLKKYKRFYQLVNYEVKNEQKDSNEKNDTKEKEYKYENLQYFNDKINDIIKDFLNVFDFYFLNKQLDKTKINFYLNTIPPDFFDIIVGKIFKSIDINEKFDKFTQDIFDFMNKFNANTDMFFPFELMKNSSFYDKDDVEQQKIFQSINGYEIYKTISEQKEIQLEVCKNNKIYQIELFNKETGNNYANCSGIYIKENTKLINKKPVYVNYPKERFISWSCGTWVLTGNQWLEEFIEKSKDTEFSFGSFHSSINSENSLHLSKWNEYWIECTFQ